MRILCIRQGSIDILGSERELYPLDVLSVRVTLPGDCYTISFFMLTVVANSDAVVVYYLTWQCTL